MRYNTLFIIISIFFYATSLSAQFYDDFSDCETKNNPYWFEENVSSKIVVNQGVCAVSLSAKQANKEGLFYALNDRENIWFEYHFVADISQFEYVDVVFCASSLYPGMSSMRKNIRFDGKNREISLVRTTTFSDPVVAAVSGAVIPNGVCDWVVFIDNEDDTKITVSCNGAEIFSASGSLASVTPTNSGIAFSAPTTDSQITLCSVAIGTRESHSSNIIDNGLIFTEIMYDPTPSVGLPEVEYVEIYNSSDEAISLENYSLKSSAATGNIIYNHLLQPHQYTVLCSEKAVNELAEFVDDFCVVSNMPALKNTGDTIRLYSADNELVATLAYDPSFYGDEKWKADSGWSLEKIDLNNKLNDATNWRPSCDPSGGTPSRENCVNGENPDTLIPKVVSIGVTQNNQVDIYFNKPMAPITELMEVVSILANNVVNHAQQDYSLSLFLEEELDPLRPIEIELTGLQCLSGYYLDTILTIALPQKATYMDFIINEIMPSVNNGQSKFIEIKNNSNYYLDLNQTALASLDDNNNILSTKQLVKQSIVIAPNTFIVITPDIASLNCAKGYNDSAYYCKASLPTFAANEGHIAIISKEGEIIDQLRYSEKYHHPLIKDRHNVSLERISATAATNDPTNWQSTSSVVGYNTAGWENSHTQKAQAQQDKYFYFEKKVITPNNDGNDDFALLHYNLPSENYALTITIYTRGGAFVAKLASNEVVEGEGVWRWNGVVKNGGMVQPGVYVFVIEAIDVKTGNKITKRLTLVVDYKAV